MSHKIHDRLPSGFAYADRLQSESYAATGSVNGASKVCLVESDDPLPYPNLAVRLRPPRTLDDVRSIGRQGVDDVDQYRRDYNAGWMAGQRGSGMDRADTTHAWDDGYLDAASGRAKWHLTWCLDHDGCGEG